MTKGERKRIAREFCDSLRTTLVLNCNRMPDTWDGCHVRAVAQMIVERTNNVDCVKKAAKSIRKSDVFYTLEVV